MAVTKYGYGRSMEDRNCHETSPENCECPVCEARRNKADEMESAWCWFESGTDDSED